VTNLRTPSHRRRAAGPAGARAASAWAVALAVAGLCAASGAVLAAPQPQGATVSGILAEVRAARAPAVLVNVWATWCDPCREEMPDLLRFYRAHRGAGLRLVLLSADDEDAGEAIEKSLADAAVKAGWTAPLDVSVYLKRDDDMTLINGLDPRWGGALPATFLFDRDGRRVQSWLAPVTYDELERAVAPRLTKSRGDANRQPKANPQKPPSSPQPRRKP
jgi:thiol-disulfide isomerase/thioredoxin